MGKEIKTNFSFDKNSLEKSFNRLIQDLSSNFKKLKNTADENQNSNVATSLLSGKVIEFLSVPGGTNATKPHGVTNPIGAIVIKNDAFNESTFMMVWDFDQTDVTVRNGDPFAVTHNITVLVF